MSSLLDLPAELVELVIDFTLPEDFESIALACKTTYSLCREHIRVHNIRKKRYNHFHYGCVGLTQTDLQLTHLLQVGVELTRYIRTADLDYGRCRVPEFFEPKYDWQAVPRLEDGHSLESLERFLMSKDTPLLETLRKKLIESFEIYVQDDPLLDGHGSDMRELDEGMNMLALESYLHPMGPLPTLALLALMPNLEELRPPFEWSLLGDIEEHCHLFPAIDEFVRATNDKTVQQEWLPRDLKRIIAFETCPDGEHAYNIACLMPFMALQSVLHITVFNTIMRDFEWRYTDTTSSLQTLELFDCFITAEEIEHLLQYMPKLEVLRYCHSEKEGCEEDDFDAAAFVRAVGSHLGDQLKELSLAAYDVFREPSRGIKSMKEFTALRKLELDLLFFHGSDDMDDMEETELPDLTPGLTDVLPTPCSISDLHLCHTSATGPEKERDDQILKELLTLSAEQIAQLSECAIEVRLDHAESQQPAIAVLARDAGAKFVLQKKMEWIKTVEEGAERRAEQLDEFDEEAYASEEEIEQAAGDSEFDQVSERFDETSGAEDE